MKPNSDEDFILSQIIAINGFIMNLSYKNMNVSKEEFDANCEKAYNDIINWGKIFKHIYNNLIQKFL